MNKKWLKNPYFQQVIPWIVPMLLIVSWQLLVQVGWLSTRVLPAPTGVLSAGIRLAISGELFHHIGISAWRALVGFIIGGGIGLTLGFLNGLFPIAEKLLDTSLQMIRNIPHLALIPLVILWFGIGDPARLFLVALGVFFPMYINTFHGIRSVDAGLIEMGKVGLAFNFGGPAIFLGDYVADADCRRNNCGGLWYWLHGNECSRVLAN
jgi:sulfonate transport system permease protein